MTELASQEHADLFERLARAKFRSWFKLALSETGPSRPRNVAEIVQPDFFSGRGR